MLLQVVKARNARLIQEEDQREARRREAEAKDPVFQLLHKTVTQLMLNKAFREGAAP